MQIKVIILPSLFHSEAEVFKEEGNAFYINKAYSEAFSCYSKAIGETSLCIPQRHYWQYLHVGEARVVRSLSCWGVKGCHAAIQNTQRYVPSGSTLLLGRDMNNCNWGYFNSGSGLNRSYWGLVDW